MASAAGDGRFSRYVYFLLLHFQVKLVNAQNVVVSSTAAWSSQIVAFWGAILIAARSSVQGQVTNAASSIFASIRVMRRTKRVTDALSRGNWFLHSGWANGPVRTDVVIICWRSREDLHQIARRVSMQIEVFADDWEVLVLGREVRGSATESVAHWVKSPHSERLCGTKVKATDETMFPLSLDDIADGIAMLMQTPKVHVNDIVQELSQRRDTRASRVTYLSEQDKELQVNAGQLSWGYIFTSVRHRETPYLSLSTWTGRYGTDRGAVMKTATRMYVMVHLMVSCAVGIMGAASGRGLAVWIMAIRPTLLTLGAENVNGCDVIESLLSLHGSILQYETGDGSSLLAGDVLSYRMPWWQLAAAFFIPIMELSIITAGWLYGALRAARLQPSGVVGHGMLWLSALAGLSLSLRALLSLRSQVQGRLVGIWRKPDYVRYTVGARSLEISISEVLRSANGTVLSLIATILRDCTVDEYIIAECALRLPITGTLLEKHIAMKVLKYKYTGDEIVAKGDGPTPVSARAIYPWFQTCCCIVTSMLCCCVSVIYAYYPLPTWVKIVTEGLLAASAMWFATLERVGGLKHHRDTYVCFMIATLVVSSIWYVGVRDVA
jgi:hypothetical protein